MFLDGLCVCGGFLGSSAGKESACNAGDPGLIPGSGRFPWRTHRLPTPLSLGFLGGLAGKRVCPQCRRPGFDPGLGRSFGEGRGYPLQYSGLENSMDNIVHGVAKNWTWLSNFHFQYFSLFVCMWVNCCLQGIWPQNSNLVLWDW